jgi:multidrug resistance efflux pump
MPAILERALRESSANPADSRSMGRKASLRDRFGKRLFGTLVGIGLVLLLSGIGVYFFAQSMSYQSTDDAFIVGHITEVAPKIAGRIDKVFIDDNQLVKKGDPIAEIDAREGAALSGAAILGVLWWGTRAPKAKKNA